MDQTAYREVYVFNHGQSSLACDSAGGARSRFHESDGFTSSVKYTGDIFHTHARTLSFVYGTEVHAHVRTCMMFHSGKLGNDPREKKHTLVENWSFRVPSSSRSLRRIF